MNSSTVSVSGVVLFTNEWVMVTAVRDRDDQTLKIYHNDQLLGTAPDKSYNVTSKADLLIGTNAALADFLNGQIDEIRLFNYALTQAEIQQLYGEVTGIEDTGPVPRSFELTNYPNPFNNSTLVKYSIPKAGNVEIDLYNMLGQKVAILVKSRLTAGTHTFNFDAGSLSSGIYIFRLQADDRSILRKIILLRLLY